MNVPTSTEGPNQHALKHQRMFGVAATIHTVGKPKRYVRRFVGSAVEFF
ncbi:unnamed protein product [Brassica rapa subsp. narinosa]